MNLYGLPETRRPELVPDFVRALPQDGSNQLAVFDADGTLWVNDVADDFTTWMIDEGHVPGDQWTEYMRIYAADPPRGCEYLLTFFRGLHREELGAFVDTYWRHHAERQWVWEAVETLYLLAERSYDIWVVSGTPTDFLLPLRHILPVAEVVAMDFAVNGEGTITGQVAGIPCAGAGKAHKLQVLADGRRVTFCAGNGSLDGPMMELADQAWSVYPNAEFADFSQERGWPILSRPADFEEEEKFLLMEE